MQKEFKVIASIMAAWLTFVAAAIGALVFGAGRYLGVW